MIVNIMKIIWWYYCNQYCTNQYMQQWIIFVHDKIWIRSIQDNVIKLYNDRQVITSKTSSYVRCVYSLVKNRSTFVNLRWTSTSTSPLIIHRKLTNISILLWGWVCPYLLVSTDHPITLSLLVDYRLTLPYLAHRYLSLPRYCYNVL